MSFQLLSASVQAVQTRRRVLEHESEGHKRLNESDDLHEKLLYERLAIVFGVTTIILAVIACILLVQIRMGVCEGK